MAERQLIPAIEQRLASLIEVARRNLREHPLQEDRHAAPTITISREFGCEGYPVAEKLQELLQTKTGTPWGVMDKALLEEVARNHNLSESILANLGEKNRILDEMISTFSPRWRSDRDNYKHLCRHIVALATVGNVIIVGRGASILTQTMNDCFHFRIVAPMAFKIRSVAKRLAMTPEEAEELITSRQHRREDFIKDFLNRDVADVALYHLLFNNAKNSVERMAETICHYVLHR